MQNAPGAKAERSWIEIAGLALEARPVDGAAVQTRRRAGLEPASAQAEFLERLAEQDRCRFSRTSCWILLLAAVNQAVKKSSSRDDDRIGGDAAAVAEQDAADAVVGR